ncbi:MAG: chitobiase/beta-hexosaminidase C-terminal domain-containing protein, partial [Clostridiales bacterium]|nr:chitobiase/beta-hexosaminidase C-terminal domain-containing protein [Clostridiales bacterium]
MKKTRKTWIAALAAGAAAILCAVLNVCSGGGAFPSVYADKAYDGAFTTQNVALNKSVTLRDLAWTDAVVSYAGLQGDSVAPAVITDGAASPHNSVLYTGVDNSAARAWAVIDLAQEYTLTEIKTSFWNDHAWAGIVVQAATDAEFTQNKITLYSNDTDDTAGQGTGAALAYTDVPDQTQAISFAPVRGRYVRVTNFDPSTPRWGSVFTEIQVFGVTGGIAPPTADRAFEYQSAPFSLALATEYQNAEIFYTTDGSFPTGASAKYTAPIDTAALGSKILIRAAVKTADGAFSLPADFRYSYALGNVLLGKAETAATFVDSAGQSVATAPWAPAGMGGTIAKITDGAFDAGNPWGTKEDLTPCWIVFDFGAQYSIDKIVMKLWNDWEFGDVFVQLSTTSDFSGGNYTVANYDYDNSLGLGAGDPAVT